MNFYVSWYPGDPHYPLYDSECCLLISVSSISNIWSMSSFKRLPSCLLLDSGGYRYAFSPKEALSPQSVFNKQLSMLEDISIPTIICARDYPILNPNLSSNQKDIFITKTIAYAYELMNLTQKIHLPENITPMAIVQGYDEDSLSYCAYEMKNIGFTLFGIGSLAELRNHDRIMHRLRVVASILDPQNIHVFGISAIDTVLAMKEMGVNSIDSARPAKSAAFNELIYSQPFRRFGIQEESEDQTLKRGRMPSHRRLKKPLPCDCPICQKNPELIMGVGKREFIRSRAVHNYYHLKKIFTG